MTTNEPDFLHFLLGRNLLGEGDVEGQYNIPKIDPIQVDFKNLDLVGFNYSTNPKILNLDEENNSWVHFFLPDHMLERVWKNPEYYLQVFNLYEGLIQPDFSLYVGMPKAMLIFQHYRRMFLAKYYQQQGVMVIPAPCWADENSFEYCFDGMPKDSCLCISTVGCVKNPEVYEDFMKGYLETLKRLTPTQLIFYGKVTKDIIDAVTVPYVQIDVGIKQRLDRRTIS